MMTCTMILQDADTGLDKIEDVHNTLAAIVTRIGFLPKSMFRYHDTENTLDQKLASPNGVPDHALCPSIKEDWYSCCTYAMVLVPCGQ